MRAPPSVGVHDDLPPCEAGVAHGAADHEVAAGVDVVLGLERRRDEILAIIWGNSGEQCIFFSP